MSPRRHSPLTIEYILLGLLYHHPKHGYELHKEIGESKGLSNIWRIKSSKLYSLLDRLEKQGLLSSRMIPHQKTPTRNQFRLTSEGERIFLDWIQSPVESGRHMRLVFHARLYFALEMGEEQGLKLIAVQRKECRGWVESMRTQLVTFENPDFTTQQVFIYRINQVEAMLAWLDGVEKSLRAGKYRQVQE